VLQAAWQQQPPPAAASSSRQQQPPAGSYWFQLAPSSDHLSQDFAAFFEMLLHLIGGS
jgi:hypothetical protein